MKIVLDTNIYISGSLWENSSTEIIRLAQDNKIKLFISSEIVQEIRRVLKTKFFINDDKIRRFLVRVLTIANIVRPTVDITVVKEDKEDNIILECANECNADFIITQDKHLLKINQFNGCKILHPSDFRFFFK
jgi:uncharacterized protein